MNPMQSGLFSVIQRLLSRARLSRRKLRTRRCSALASREYGPCFQFARRDLANPDAVRGPVLVPPCIRQRPLGIAGLLHDVPARVFAPQRGALLKSPTALSFFNQPRLPIEFTHITFVLVGGQRSHGSD
jgi:hypothetical protein